MKSDLFADAIKNRNKIKFLYSSDEIILDPYFISLEKNGKKVLYGRTHNSKEIKKFEYTRITNIKILNNVKFTPLIPILPIYTYRNLGLN
ncbi:MAG TPA: WYL domain-containing protein [Ignavibacteriaceae bacterium]|nr:WYL domain-containing protein [Ignavibacteriaceae bacterium]